MRHTNSLTIAAGIVLVVTSLASFAGAEVIFFEFPAWDHSQVIGGGQTFTNIVPGIDVTVSGSGVFDAPSVANTEIKSSHDDANSHEFVFTFSQPLELAITTFHLDADERYRIDSPASIEYVHESGLLPRQTMLPLSLMLEGDGFGVDAAAGTSMTGMSNTVTVSYESLGSPSTKYSSFQVGQVVPEPASAALLLLLLTSGLVTWRRGDSAA